MSPALDDISRPSFLPTATLAILRTVITARACSSLEVLFRLIDTLIKRRELTVSEKNAGLLVLDWQALPASGSAGEMRHQLKLAKIFEPRVKALYEEPSEQDEGEAISVALTFGSKA